MALTQEERKRILEVIARTTPKAGSYPEECYEFLKLCDQEKIQRSADGHQYQMYIVRPHRQTPNCPVHINVHGGGFIRPHAENDSMYSAYLADRIGGIVVDVDYTTSDQASWPVAFHQCYDAAAYAFSQCKVWGADAAKVSMGGYSAGGSLTAGVALKAAETGDFQFCLQVLGYPVLDSVIPSCYKKDGYRRRIPLERMEAFNRLYFDGDKEAAAHPYASPLYAEDELLARLPRTLMCTCENCDFHYEDEEYALRLASLGVEVTLKRFPGTAHGFIPHFMFGWKDAADLIVQMILDSKTNSLN